MSGIEDVVEFLHKNNLTVATAESCTAGMVASQLARVSGCGTALEGGYIVYSQQAKHNYLGVSLETMERCGLTSEEVARELTYGLAGRSNANFLISITGTAESDDSLNGVVCFGYGLKVNGHLRVLSETRRFDGERNTVILAAAHYAVEAIPDAYRKLLASTNIHPVY